MGGIILEYREILTNNRKAFRTVHIFSIICSIGITIFYIIKSQIINFANVYSNYNNNGIENHYSNVVMAISFAVLFAFLLVSYFIIYKKSKHIKISMIATGVICVIIILSCGISNYYINSQNEIYTYNNSIVESNVKTLFPIDNFSYNENSKNNYYFKDVHYKNIYWAGSSSYKDFAEENSTVYLSEEPTDSTVYLTYYYIKDDSKKMINLFNRNKEKYDNLSNDEYTVVKHIGNYTILESDYSYEFLLIDDTEVFYLSASKNKRTKYTYKDIEKTAFKQLKILSQRV